MTLPSYGELTEEQKSLAKILHDRAWSEAHNLEWDYYGVQDWYNDHKWEFNEVWKKRH